MKFEVNYKKNTTFMEMGVWYFAHHNNFFGEIVVVQRVPYNVSGINDAVLFLSDSVTTYGELTFFKHNYTILEPVNSITIN